MTKLRKILTKVIKKVKGAPELFPQNIIFYVLEPYNLYPRMDRVRHFEVSSGHLSYCLSEKPLISFDGTNLIDNHVFLAYNFKHFFSGQTKYFKLAFLPPFTTNSQYKLG